MFPKTNGVVAPKPGSPILYVCNDCGENFSAKKSLLPKFVKCPKCGSTNCISPIIH